LTSSGVQDGSVVARKVDITEKGVKSALDALALAVGAKVDDDDLLDGNEQKKLFVKVSPPIWVRVIPSPDLVATGSHSQSAWSQYPTLEMFMSSWTRLVGDPVFSKWIVVALAISISLNGYLLKGIAAGLGLGLGLVRREGDGVRFSDGETDNAVEVVEKEQDKVKKTTKSGRQLGAVPTFTLEDVDRRLELKANSVGGLKKRRGTTAKPSSPVVATRPSHLPTPPAPTPHVHAPSSVIAPPTPALPSPPPPIDDSERIDGAEPVVRSLKECIDIYENGPRPASLALDMLNDEEVIVLAQNGKIAAYALEKVLGGERLERAVRIRRALVCEFLFFFALFFLFWLGC
jgi:hydroxymethylglutaryl-CoA reductase (NADPH)